jgi:hypothetical protein
MEMKTWIELGPSYLGLDKEADNMGCARSKNMIWFEVLEWHIISAF